MNLFNDWREREQNQQKTEALLLFIREFKKTTTATATEMSLNKRFKLIPLKENCQ